VTIQHRILGIDPGSRICGFAMLTSTKVAPSSFRDFVVEDAGVLRADLKLTFIERIGLLHECLEKMLPELAPTCCVIEDAFFGNNARSALKLGQARGALISAVVKKRIPTYEVAPTKVKSMVTGKGGASKEDVAKSLEVMLGFKRGKLPYDAVDAVAIALTHGLSMFTERAALKAGARESKKKTLKPSGARAKTAPRIR
jgi:crossover junction endodeoxyribonuclease RuvC